MADRVFNFNAGPAALPLSVLEEAQSELVNYKGTGMSLMEMSHRTKEYEAINDETEALIKELLGISDGYRVLFLQGGASTQFAMVPMNFLPSGKVADYILTGTWSQKALEEAQKIGQTHVSASSEDAKFNYIPSVDRTTLSESPAYIHITTNNTIYGTQWQSFPDFGSAPLIADMSSDILSKPFDASKFALIYAGAQKNLGPAGVTIVIIRDDMLEKVPGNIPTMLKYSIHAKNSSLYNTPPVFSIYMVNLVLKWIKGNGGLAAMDERNKTKAKLIYDVIDASGGFYKGHARVDSRSLMNITFTLPGEELEKAFASEASKNNMIGLKGHRSVGGMRASIYNAVPVEACQALAEFMKEFQRKNG